MDELMKKIRREKEGKARGHHRYVQYSRIRLTAAMKSKRFTTTPRDSHTINLKLKQNSHYLNMVLEIRCTNINC
jgi:hypothetical protein